LLSLEGQDDLRCEKRIDTGLLRLLLLGPGLLELLALRERRGLSGIWRKHDAALMFCAKIDELEEAGSSALSTRGGLLPRVRSPKRFAPGRWIPVARRKVEREGRFGEGRW